MSCATYNFRDLYPAYYGDSLATKDGLIYLEFIPTELVDSLPIEFQIAQFSGHLWCYRDNNGNTDFFKIKKSIQKTRWSKDFSHKLNLIQGNDDYSVSTPLGYPQMFCFMPKVDSRELLNETWFRSWLIYFSTWEANEIENQSLISTNRKLIVDISDLSKLILNIEDSINNYNNQIKETERLIEETEVLINERKSRLGGNLIVQEGENKLPPFDSKIPYSKDKDPFISVVKDNTADVSDKSWASDQMGGGKFLDNELAGKIQEVNDVFANPEKISDESLKQDIKTLKENGFNGITVTSGARTPWRQADLYSNAKRNSNPVGKYLRSDHMFGQAADMSIPKGWSWDSTMHKKLRSVMNSLGIGMNVANDPVHFTLTSPSHSYYARRLVMVRAYHAKATQIKSAQGAVKENAIFEKSTLLEQKTRLEGDLKARSDELTKRADIFARVSAAYLTKQRELQKLDAEIARRADEAKKRSEEEERRKRSGREPREPRPPRERPEPTPPAVERPEPPQREPPHRDPPQRDPPSLPGGVIG